MNVLYLILLVGAAFCFALSAFYPSRTSPKVSLVPLGLLLWVLVPLIQAFQVIRGEQ